MAEDAKEAEKKRSATEDAKAVCGLLAAKKSAISGEEDELSVAALARELGGAIKALADVIALVELSLSPLSKILMRESLESVFAPKSKALVWFKAIKTKWIEENTGIDKLFARTADGLVKKFAEGSSTVWLQRLLEAKLERDESPTQLADRMKMFNENAGKSMTDKQMRDILLTALKRGDGSDLMLNEATQKEGFGDAATAAEKVWERDGVKNKARPDKAKVAAVAEGGRVMKANGCWFCGDDGHMLRKCPIIPCTGCAELGHMLSDCNKSKGKYEQKKRYVKDLRPAKRVAGVRRVEAISV
jgi:hypothetical protein